MGPLIDHLLRISRLRGTELTHEWVYRRQLVAGIAAMLQEAEPQRRVVVCVEKGLMGGRRRWRG